MTYTNYLKSDHWKSLRKKKMEKARNKQCSVCFSKEKLEVHHLFYRNLEDVNTDDLRILCRDCHQCCHDLMKNGQLVFKKDGSHLHKFAVMQDKVRKEKGIYKNKKHLDRNQTSIFNFVT